MANEYGLFWNSENGDRTYDADNFAELLNHFFTTGVFEGELQVVANSNMTVSVKTGYCNIEGKVKLFDSITNITLDVANSVYPRIDTIVIEKNITSRNITLKKVTGEISSSVPVATAPVRNETQYQIVLAQIYVGAGVSEITQANITDTRTDSSICGYVSGTVKEIDYSQISAQWSSYLDQFKTDNLDEFNEWFETIQGILGKDEAAKLLAMINANTSSIETNTTNISTNTTNISTNTTNISTNTKNIASIQGKMTILTITLGTSWTQDSTNGYYYQSVSNGNITSSDNPVLDVVLSGTSTNMQTLQKEWAKILKAETYNNGIKFYAKEATTTRLTIIVKR